MVTVTSKHIRETAAARRERVAQEENAMYEHGMQEALDVWPSRLMTMLERATKFGWAIEVREGKFIVGHMTAFPVGLVPTGTPAIEGVWRTRDTGCWCGIVSIESELDAIDRELEEANRRLELRKAALGKLTKEEREELGV